MPCPAANGLTRNSLFSMVKEVTATRDKEESVRRGMEYQKSLKQAKESSNEARQKAATALSAMPSTQVGYSLHCSLVGSSGCRC